MVALPTATLVSNDNNNDNHTNDDHNNDDHHNKDKDRNNDDHSINDWAAPTTIVETMIMIARK